MFICYYLLYSSIPSINAYTYPYQFIIISVLFLISYFIFSLPIPSYTPHDAGFYFTGDGCRRDSDGYYWITGRVDDVINPSGHRIGTAEVESSLVACREVSEAAVVGFPHEVKGEGILCFVILKNEFQPSPEITK